MLEILKKQKNNVMLPGLLPENTVLAHKIGELGGVENDVVIVYLDNGDYILSVLTQKLPDTEMGKNTIASISKVIFDAVSLVNMK